MRFPALLLIALIAASTASTADAQHTGMERLAADVLDVMPPSARVRGAPGGMAIRTAPCRVLPTAETRQRIVDVAMQEWAFFGFGIVDWTDPARTGSRPGGSPGDVGSGERALRGGFRRRWLDPAQAARVASSIAGYWAVTSEGAWIVGQQNELWNGPDGIAARWNAPWSAAFISWVMCEAGLGATSQFQRAVAHHTYIDQAIRARDGRAPEAAFVAYDTGETAITPGDLLCSSRRPVYRALADRRRQTGVGARTHCDVVVKVDEAGERILAIGGNVRGAVSLKLLRAQREAGKPLRVVDPDEDSRPIFAHLKLRAEPGPANALDSSATMKALGCALSTHTRPVPGGAGVLMARC